MFCSCDVLERLSQTSYNNRGRATNTFVSELTNLDAVGNPTNWRGISSLTWESGKRLMAATLTDGTALSYTYDMDGLRLSKTVGSTEHKYVWQGSRLISETFGTKTLEFF